MTTVSNLHTHCTFCDGKNTIEEMVGAAVSAGFESVGFSGHYHTGYDFDDVQMHDQEGYFRELEAVKKKYAGIIKVYKGLELESHVLGEGRPVIDPRCDFTIGSVHYLADKGEHFTIDDTAEKWNDCLKSFGSAEKLVEYYFEDYLSFAREMPFDIVGHIDIYTKLNEKHHLFDETESWYEPMVLSYVDKVAATGKIFEVNTGGMGKGYMTRPYPAPFILRRLLKLGAPVIISSDAHRTTTICHAFEETERMLRDMGFREQMKLTDGGFVSVPL